MENPPELGTTYDNRAFSTPDTGPGSRSPTVYVSEPPAVTRKASPSRSTRTALRLRPRLDPVADLDDVAFRPQWADAGDEVEGQRPAAVRPRDPAELRVDRPPLP
jgi:hypothetical protein